MVDNEIFPEMNCLADRLAQRLIRIAMLHKTILDCDCDGWCTECCDRFTEIGELAADA